MEWNSLDAVFSGHGEAEGKSLDNSTSPLAKTHMGGRVKGPLKASRWLEGSSFVIEAQGGRIF